MAQGVVRKAGDRIFLGGTLTGTNLPPVPWTGATGTINIKALEIIYDLSGVIIYQPDEVIINQAPLTTFDVTTLAWTWNIGTSPSVAGLYAYEVQITFQDGAVQTFPNNEDMPLQMVKQIA